MYRSSLVTGLAVAFSAMSLVFLALGIAYNPLILAAAAIFGAVSYFMWYHATGRLAERVYRSVEGAATTERQRTATDGRGGFGAGPRGEWQRPGAASRERVRQERARRQRDRRRRARDYVRGGRWEQASAGRRTAGGNGRMAADHGMGYAEAANVLGVAPDADEETVRAAYRERIKEVHPDTDGGDEARFRRVQTAYERLTE